MVSTTSIISEQLILNAGRTMFRGPQVGYLQCIFFFRKKLLKKKPLRHSAVTSSCLTVPFIQEAATFYTTKLSTV